MRNKIFIGLLLTVLCPSVSFAETAVQSAPSVSAVASDLTKKISRAAKLEKQSKFIEARDAYQKLLKGDRLDAARARKIRSKVENLNVKILFSPAEQPETVMHEIVVGDSLSKLAKKYGTTIELIKKSNRMEKDTVILGKKIKILNKAEFSIKIDKSKNSMVLYMNDKPFKHYRVATGTNSGTPEGDFKIINKIENPIWYKTGAVIPAGDPNNYLGTRWLGIDSPGYGIHGTTEPETIGQQSSSGCVRMLNEEVEELYVMVPLNTRVKITE